MGQTVAGHIRVMHTAARTQGTAHVLGISIRLLPIMLIAVPAHPASAGSTQVSGKLGYLSEWELSANVTERRAAGKTEFVGPLTVRHVGMCTTGRPVEMSGEIRYRVTGWIKPRMTATLLLDGVECGFEGSLSDAYDGVMSCPQWNGVPVRLRVKPQ
jgi:hypothetical protein